MDEGGYGWVGSDKAPPRRDVILGIGVVVVLSSLVYCSSRIDTPIQAPLTLDAVLASELSERRDHPLPPVDAPCLGTLLAGTVTAEKMPTKPASVMLCRIDKDLGSLGLRLDRKLDFPAQAVLPLEGEVYIGGPWTPEWGILLYRAESGDLRWTTSKRGAKAAANASSEAWLFFGHLKWGPGELEAALHRGQLAESKAAWP